MRPVVSIIICTCNRAESLRETLASISRCVIPADLLTQLLIVDNASTDQTEQVALDAALPNIPMRYIREPRRGKGFAYNSGMAMANGDIFLFTDDDVRVPANWIERMARPILNCEADAVQGDIKIAPHLLRPTLSSLCRALGAETSIDPKKSPESLVGANMAFSRRILEKVPEFDVELGPGALGFGDETLFSSQLLAAGYRIMGVTHAPVIHHCDPRRFDYAELLQIAKKIGRSLAYRRYHWDYDDLKFPRLRMAQQAVKIWARRLLDFGHQRDVPPDWMLWYTMHLFCAAQFLHEQKRPRNYERRGLIKRVGALR